MNILDVLEVGEWLGPRAKRVIAYGTIALALVAPNRFQQLVMQAAHDEADRMVTTLTTSLTRHMPEAPSPRFPTPDASDGRPSEADRK